jgi:hypothetical protein
MDMVIPGFKILIALTFAVVTMVICRKIFITGYHLKINSRITVGFCVVICSWAMTAFILSLKGFFNNVNQYSAGDIVGLVWLVATMLLPIIVFFLGYHQSDAIKQIIAAVDVKALIGLQVYRLCGAYFLLLALSGQAPLLFAIPPGVLDVLMGTSAVIIPGLISKQVKISLSLAKIWNYIGLFDFALAFTIYFMYFPFKIFAAPASQILIGGFFPIAFFIVFLVPLAIILHILTLMKLNRFTN